eukprot:6201937-Lingulodinium_polyedra.AAC.1
MPASGRKSEVKRESRARAKASKAYVAHTQEATKAYLAKFIDENPDSHLHIKEFCTQKLWRNANKSGAAKVSRFCRSRSTVEKLPPSWQRTELSKLSGLSATVLEKCRAREETFLSRCWAFGLDIVPSRRIADVMDRRIVVFEKLAEERHKFLGERLKKLKDFIEKDSLEAMLESVDDQWPWEDCGLFKKLDDEGKEIPKNADKDIEVAKVVHISGAEAINLEDEV